MKAEELMIGDWVRGFVPDSNSTIYGIFNEQRVAIIAEPSKAYIELSIDDIQPILITPEILQKSGFGFIEREEKLTHFYLGEGQICSNKDIHIGTDNYRFWVNNYMSNIFGLYFVHELQHAFRILGIEKEVVL